MPSIRPGYMWPCFSFACTWRTRLRDIAFCDGLLGGGGAGAGAGAAACCPPPNIEHAGSAASALIAMTAAKFLTFITGVLSCFAAEDILPAGQSGPPEGGWRDGLDRKSTRLNSSHVKISYAVFCLKKKKK